MADFTHYTNYIPGQGVNGVIFSAGKTVLEVELNELQEINKREARRSLYASVGDGIVSHVQDSIIINKVGEVTIKGDTMFLIDGIVIYVTEDIKISNVINESIWLNVVEFEGTFSTPIHQCGDVTMPTIENWFKDDRGESETTRRIVMEFSFDKKRKEYSDYDENMHIMDKHNMEIVRYSGGNATLITVPRLHKDDVVNVMLEASKWETIGDTFVQSVNNPLITGEKAPTLIKDSYITANIFNPKLLDDNSSTTLLSSDNRMVTVTGIVANANSAVKIPIDLVSGKTVMLSSTIEGTNGRLQLLISKWDGTQSKCNLDATGTKKCIVDDYIKEASIVLYANTTSAALTEANDVIYRDIVVCVGDTAIPWRNNETVNVSLMVSAPMHGFSNIYDCIKRKNGRWGIERRFKQITLNGDASEAWTVSATNTTGKNRFISSAQASEIKNEPDADTPIAIKCTGLNGVSSRETYMCSDGISGGNNGQICVYIDAVSDNDVEAFKLFLQQNPMTVVFERKTPLFGAFSDSVQQIMDKMLKFNGSIGITTTLMAPDTNTYPEISGHAVAEMEICGVTKQAGMPQPLTPQPITSTQINSISVTGTMMEQSPAEQKAYMKAFGMVASGSASVVDGEVTFTAYKKPATDISVGLLY